MDKEHNIRTMILALCFMFWGILLTVVLGWKAVPATEYQQIVWWFCSASVAVFLVWSKSFDNPIGAVMCIAFGPLTILTFALGYLILVERQRRINAKKEKTTKDLGKDGVHPRFFS